MMFFGWKTGICHYTFQNKRPGVYNIHKNIFYIHNALPFFTYRKVTEFNIYFSFHYLD